MRRLVSCVLTGALMAALAMPAVAAQTPGSAAASTQTPIAPTTLPSLAQASQLLQQLEASVGSLPASDPQAARVDGIALDLVGWGLAAVGLAVDGGSEEAVTEGLADISSGLDAVQNSLDAISDELAQMSQELSAISEQAQWSDCAELTQVASGPAAAIQTAAGEYNQFVTQATNATSSEPAPQVDAMVAWAQDFTGGSNDLLAALIDINNVLMGTGTVKSSSLTACSSALAGMYSGQAAFAFEQAYYTPLYQYLSYWYQMQVQGLNLYVEAQHVLALDAAGDLSGFDPTEPNEICTQAISGPVTTACESAYAQVSSVYDNLAGQMYMAGAPYLWGTGGMVSAPWPNTNDKAWLLDINDFQSDGCTLPLTSISGACGGTAGTTGGFTQPTWGPFSWGSYAAWKPAVTADWLALIPASAQTGYAGNYAQWLQQEGLGDSSWGSGAGLQDLILYTGEVTNSTNPDLDPGTWWSWKPGSTFQNQLMGMCLLDTDWGPGDTYYGTPQPLCDDVGGGVLSVLVDRIDPSNSTWSGAPPTGANGPRYQGGGPFTPTSFYDAAFSEGPKNSPWWVEQVPGWMTWTYGMTGGGGTGFYQYTPTPQYRWPVLPLTQSMCDAAPPGSETTMSLITTGGAYTMCGEDFEAWLRAQLPPAPLPAPATSVSSAPQLGAAVVSWRPSKDKRHVTGYRIRGQRQGGSWKTMRTVSAMSAKRQIGARVTVKRSGWWRFKVVTLDHRRKSRPSKPSRAEYVAVRKHAQRFYTFRDGDHVRIAKAFSDGRVYFAGKNLSGAGEIRKGAVRGHTYRGQDAWSGRWVQPVSGSWKNLRWDGWTRVKGPASTRAGMPLPKKRLQRW